MRVSVCVSECILIHIDHMDHMVSCRSGVLCASNDWNKLPNVKRMNMELATIVTEPNKNDHFRWSTGQEPSITKNQQQPQACALRIFLTSSSSRTKSLQDPITLNSHRNLSMNLHGIVVCLSPTGYSFVNYSLHHGQQCFNRIQVAKVSRIQFILPLCSPTSYCCV